MNQENQLIKFSQQELIKNFQEKLKENQIKVSYHSQDLSIFGLWTEVETSLAENDTGIDLESIFRQMIKCYYNSYDINWKEVANFIKNIENISQTKAIEAFQGQSHQMTTWASETIKNVVDNSELAITQKNKEIVEKDVMINNKERQLTILQEEINCLKQELKETKEDLLAIDQQLQEANDRFSTEIDWLELQRNRQGLINSPEDSSLNQLAQLKNKYEDLSEQQVSAHDLLAQKRIELKEYIKLAEKLAERETSLSEQLNQLLVKQTQYSRKILQLEATRIGLISQVRQEITQRKAFGRKLDSYPKDQQAWAAEKAFAQAKLQEWKDLDKKNQGLFNQTALDNARLKSKLIELNDIIANGIKHVDSLEQTIAKSTKELNQLKTEVNRLEKLQRINLLGKSLKWTSRFCLPASWAQGIEIGIDAYEIKQTVYPGSYELTWMILGITTFFFLKKILTYFFPGRPKTINLTQLPQPDQITKQNHASTQTIN